MAYLVIGLLAVLKSAAFVGLFVTVGAAMRVGGALAAAGHADLAVMHAVVGAAGIAGGGAGYAIGRVLGPRPRRRAELGWRGGARRMCRRVGVRSGAVLARAGRGGCHTVGALALATAVLVRLRRASAWSPSRPSGVLVATVAVGGVLAALVAELWDNVIDAAGLTAADRPVLGWMVAHRDGTTTAVMTAVSDAGSTLAMAGLAAVGIGWFAWRRRWDHAALLVAATLGAGALVVGVKALVGRTRPPLATQIVLETNQSFPSGHTLGSTAVLGMLAVLVAWPLRHRLARLAVGAATAVAVLAIGMSRLYLGVHWATDVLAGWLIGALWIVVCLAAALWWRAGRATPGAAGGPSPTELEAPAARRATR